MGAGKTTLANELAEVLGRGLRDSDAHLEAATGRTAAQLQAERGQAALHALERDHLLGALAADDADATVVAAAASVVDAPAARAALGDAFVVWLDGDPTLLAERAAGGEHRPGRDDLRTLLTEQHADRAPHFAAVADRIVDAVRPTTAQVADVLAALDVEPRSR